MPLSRPSTPKRRSADASRFARAWPALAVCAALALLGVLLVRQPTPYRLTSGIALLAAAAGWLAWLVAGRALRRVAVTADAEAADAPLAWLDRAADVDAVDARAPQASSAADPAQTTMTVAYASQTGFAEQIARQTAQSLEDAGMTVDLLGLDELDADALAGLGRILIVSSTTGDGDPPDAVISFFDHCMAAPAELSGLRYGLLALGDRDYDDFCGFGHKIDRWLQASGAKRLFDVVEVDSEDEAALRHWQQRLGTLSGTPDLPDWQPPRYQRWQLTERTLLNPDSLGAPCFHLALTPKEGRASWEAGDIAEIGPCHAPQVVDAWLAQAGLDGGTGVSVLRERLTLATLLARSRLPALETVAGLDAAGVAAIVQRLPHREYSIASIPQAGAVHLLVRQMRSPQGELGLGSSWLTEQAPLGAEIALRIRSNVNFHVPAGDAPLILIGNGTGMAALRALLAARIAAGRRRNWLLFGERQAERDFFYGDEIKRWLASGELERADFAWSRDQPERIHVQDRVAAEAAALREWVAAGASIYVCGALAGMAPAVDAALFKALGAEAMDSLRRDGRYRRDVY